MKTGWLRQIHIMHHPGPVEGKSSLMKRLSKASWFKGSSRQGAYLQYFNKNKCLIDMLLTGARSNMALSFSSELQADSKDVPHIAQSWLLPIDSYLLTFLQSTNSRRLFLYLSSPLPSPLQRFHFTCRKLVSLNQCIQWHPFLSRCL